MDICQEQFVHDNVRRALTGVDKSVRHKVSQAKAVSPEILRSVKYVTSGLHCGPTIKFLMLVMYMTMLRQSNFCPVSVKKFNKTRHMTRRDVSIDSGGLLIAVKWEKNLQLSTAATEVLIPATFDPIMCPVSAYKHANLCSYQVVGPAPNIIS